MGAGGKPQTVQAARQGWSMGSILNVDSLYLPAKAVGLAALGECSAARFAVKIRFLSRNGKAS